MLGKSLNLESGNIVPPVDYADTNDIIVTLWPPPMKDIPHFQDYELSNQKSKGSKALL